MKYFALLIAALVIPCAAVQAQFTGGGNPGTVGGPPSGGNTSGGGGWIAKSPAEAAKIYIQSIDSSVGLTDDQKQQINDIFADRAKQIADFNAQNAEKIKAAGEAMSKAFNSQDQDAMAKSRQDYQDANAPMQDIIKKSSDRLDKVLTPAQKAAQEDARLTKMIQWLTKPAELTDNQLKALKAAVKAGENPFETAQTIKDALDIVLTPAQKAAINKSRAMEANKRQFYRANLTADQVKQVDAACDQIVKDSSLDLKAITEALADKTTALLTADQKKVMESPAKAGDRTSLQVPR